MSRNWPIAVLALVLIAIVGVSCYTDPSNQEKQNSTGNNSPTLTAAQNEAGHATQNAQTSKRSPMWRKLIAWPEGVTALAVLFTLCFIGWQALLTRQAIAPSHSASRAESQPYFVLTISPLFNQLPAYPTTSQQHPP